MNAKTLERVSTQYFQAEEAATEVLVEALSVTYKNLTGKWPSDRVRHDLWYAVRHDR